MSMTAFYGTSACPPLLVDCPSQLVIALILIMQQYNDGCQIGLFCLSLSKMLSELPSIQQTKDCSKQALYRSQGYSKHVH